MSAARSATARKGGGGALVALLVLMLPLGLFVMPTTVLLLAGLIPTFVALLVDRDPERSLPLTVGSMNLCGIMPYGIQLWQSGHTMAGVARMLSEPGTWMIMYAAAGVGWLFYFVVPQIVGAVAAMRSEARVKELEAQRAALVAEWGPEIIGKPSTGAEPKGVAEGEG